MLEIKDLYKSYDKKEALRNVSLTVKPGEIHGLIGENSAGKTTLIKCAVGIYRADKGEITYDDKPVFDNPEVKVRIGYVADYNDYIGYYKVKRMVKTYCYFYPKFSVERFNELNQIFNIPVDLKISSLSKGQKMRLAYMMELSKEPDYLILDEPTSGLDPVAKAKFFEILINEVETRNIGVLISSHNLESLERICDTVTMLKSGEVEKQMTMDAMKEELTELNVVFEGGAPKELSSFPDVLKISNVGSIYTLIVKNYDEKFMKKLKEMGAGLIEPVDISLEELFIVLQSATDKEGEHE
ncbi:MAG: ABC transporter ATP-binding protein [Lachnospiraceae bacterium]|nr:ABC transporter ATP-binding protein [Lachnospiraceae bacterium]